MDERWIDGEITHLILKSLKNGVLLYYQEILSLTNWAGNVTRVTNVN